MKKENLLLKKYPCGVDILKFARWKLGGNLLNEKKIQEKQYLIVLKYYTLLLIDYPIKLIIHFEKKNNFKQASE